MFFHLILFSAVAGVLVSLLASRSIAPGPSQMIAGGVAAVSLLVTLVCCLYLPSKWFPLGVLNIIFGGACSIGGVLLMNSGMNRGDQPPPGTPTTAPPLWQVQRTIGWMLIGIGAVCILIAYCVWESWY